MSKQKCCTLNTAGRICALLVLINLMLGRPSDHSARNYSRNHIQLNRAQQMQQTIQAQALRVAQAGSTEPATFLATPPPTKSNVPEKK